MIEPTRLTRNLLVLGVPAFSDNYLWLLSDSDGSTVAVDPGDEGAIQTSIDKHNLRLEAILITHHHSDHIGGAAALARRHHCPVFGPVDPRIPMVTHPIADGDTIALSTPDIRMQVMHVPGHTHSHLAYVGHGAAFVGDTLFSAGCGRLFEGGPEEMLHSLDRLSSLPSPTLVFCAHEYTRDNARFALEWEPDSEALRRRYADACEARILGKSTVPSSIGDERTFNPFLRCDQADIRRRVRACSEHIADDRLAVFTQLRLLKNSYVARH